MAAMAVASFLAGGAVHADPADQLEHVKVELVAPPLVHPHDQATNAAARVVEFRMVLEEKKVLIDEASGATLQAMTCHGSMPGPTLEVDAGNSVHLTQVNPVNTSLENIRVVYPGHAP